MKVLKKSFRFGLKLCRQYNSVDVAESIKVEIDENQPVAEQYQHFEIMKDELIGRVKNMAKTQLELIK